MNQDNLIYIIEGDPIPLARARHGRGKTWDSQKKEKLYIQLLLERIHGNRPLYQGPLYLEMFFYMEIPKTSSQRALTMENTWHYFRPDASNLLKFIEDVATGILYKDDCLISSITCHKKYSQKPRTEFTIKELK